MDVVDGQIAVERSQLLTMNEDKVIEQHNQHTSALYKRASIELVPKWTVR